MPQNFEFCRRIARLRAFVPAALLVALVACDRGGAFTPDNSMTPQDADQGPLLADEANATEVIEVSEAATANASFSGGIPIGIAQQPLTYFGSRYNGSKLTLSPTQLRSALATVKSRGGKVVLMLVGPEQNFKNAAGNFDLAKWKARVDRFKNVDFDSYVNDGTVIGHFLIDEPNDPYNWNGKPVTPSTLEEMGRYSKQYWPNMATIVRVDPSYLSSNHRYIDAAWAQYLSRRGNVNDYIRRVVNDAQNRGLGLVVGLNLLKGGTPNGTKMTSSEVVTWGSALLSSSYPCAFISYTYGTYVSSGTLNSAMDQLRRKAESRSARSCRG
jgi:hypothetical protein